MAHAFTFGVATANIHETILRRKRVEDCIKVAREGSSVVALQEMSRRRAHKYFPKHWRTVQRRGGFARRRVSISFNQNVWAYVSSDIKRCSHSHVIGSGTRWSLAVVLRHRTTDVEVAFTNYDSVAHIDHGGRFGWTRGGQLTHRISHRLPNPLVKVYKRGMQRYMEMNEVLQHKHAVIAMGDWNFDQRADERRNKHGHGEKWAPYHQLKLHRMQSQFMHGEKRNTLGKRQVDIIAITHKECRFTKTEVVNSPFSDHRVAKARVRVGPV